MNPLTEAREAVVAVLETLGVTTYATTPAAGVLLPAASLVPDAPWCVDLTFSKSAVSFQLTLFATMIGTNAAAMERLEELAWAARAALRALGMVGQLGGVDVRTLGQTEVAFTTLAVTVHVEDD